MSLIKHSQSLGFESRMREVLFKEAHEGVGVGRGHSCAHGSSFNLKVILGVKREVVVRMNCLSWIRNWVDGKGGGRGFVKEVLQDYEGGECYCTGKWHQVVTLSSSFPSPLSSTLLVTWTIIPVALTYTLRSATPSSQLIYKCLLLIDIGLSEIKMSFFSYVELFKYMWFFQRSFAVNW